VVLDRLRPVPGAILERDLAFELGGRRVSSNIESLSPLQRLQLVWHLMRDDRVASWVKKVGPAAIIAYVISPIDLIPDVLIGPGQVDDLGVLAIGLVLMVRLLVRFAPHDVVAEHVSRITGTWTDVHDPAGSAAGPTIDTSGRVR
jgi:uncharacterized membrane protein YkvA (DUF1232 family)